MKAVIKEIIRIAHICTDQREDQAVSVVESSDGVWVGVAWQFTVFERAGSVHVCETHLPSGASRDTNDIKTAEQWIATAVERS